MLDGQSPRPPALSFHSVEERTLESTKTPIQGNKISSTKDAGERFAGTESQAPPVPPHALSREIAKIVYYNYFAEDRLISREELTWVRDKLRKYCGLPPIPDARKQAGDA
jgi:hypothetical protein